MSHRVSRSLTVMLAVVMAASLMGSTSTAHRGTEPPFADPPAGPLWLPGVWAGNTAVALLPLEVRDNGVSDLAASPQALDSGAAQVTAHSAGLILTVKLSDRRFLLAGPRGRVFSGMAGRASRTPLQGYFVSYVDRISPGEVRITEIDYYRRVNGLAAGQEPHGTGLCSAKSETGPPCGQPDAGILLRLGDAALLARSDSTVPYHRVRASAVASPAGAASR